MREILFRGKRVDNDEWATGYLVRGEHYIYETEITAIYPPDTIFYPNTETTGYDRVFPETIGQYTGLTDKNGKKIFEGDIIKAYFQPQNFKNPPYAIGSVIFENGTFKVVVHISKNSIEYKVFEKEDIAAYSIEHNFLDRYYVLEVIGNIYDNPELLEVEND